MQCPYREKCPNTENTGKIQGLNTGKYGQEKTPYLDIFHVVHKKAEESQVLDSSFICVTVRFLGGSYNHVFQKELQIRNFIKKETLLKKEEALVKRGTGIFL